MAATAPLGALVDPFARPATDLRIAVTQECHLRCGFCHHEGARNGPCHMRPDEIARIVRVGAALGIQSIKLTGGEPLARPDLEDIVAAIRPHVREISLVTNGHFLGPRAAALKKAGLDRVNVSLHSLDPDTYQSITGSRAVPTEAIRLAREAGLDVKVNLVVTRDTLPEVTRTVEWAQLEGLPLQLIEIHGSPEQWPTLQDRFASLEPAEAWLESIADRVTWHRLHSRPVYHLAGATVEITRPMGNWSFCAGCKRLRLTADGRFQTCLLRPRFVDVLGPLRAGCTDERLVALYRDVVAQREPTWLPPGETTLAARAEGTPWPAS